MNTIEKIAKLERLHKLIKRKYNGSAVDYAAKLNISRSSLFNFIDELKIAGAEICYSRSLNSFVYLNDFVFKVVIKYETISNNGMKNIIGGYINFFCSVHFFRWRYITFKTEKLICLVFLVSHHQF